MQVQDYEKDQEEEKDEDSGLTQEKVFALRKALGHHFSTPCSSRTDRASITFTKELPP